jgi:hypothetical protein
LKNAGKDYTYTLSAITNTGSITITPVIKSAAPFMMSMTVQEDLRMHLYINKSELENAIAKVTVGGIRLMSNAYELVTINGVSYYKHDILSFAPAKASDKVEIVIEYLDGSVKKTSICAVEYLEELLAVSDNDEEKTVAVKLLKYIHSAQTYFGTTGSAEQDRIVGIINAYKEYDVIFGNLKKENVNASLLRDAIASASFNLSASVRIKFYLKSGYTGPIQMIFEGVTTTYNVTNGTVDGKNYIEVVMSATQINSPLILSDGVNSIYYGLNAYYTSLNSADRNLDNLLFCLSEYSSAARKYVTE